jgi:hypothetical protein
MCEVWMRRVHIIIFVSLLWRLMAEEVSYLFLRRSFHHNQGDGGWLVEEERQ